MKTNKFVFASLALLVVMDASAGYDIDKIEEYASQFEAIATIISKNASSAIESFNEFDVTNVGVPKKFKPFLIGIARLDKILTYVSDFALRVTPAT